MKTQLIAVLFFTLSISPAVASAKEGNISSLIISPAVASANEGNISNLIISPAIASANEGNISSLSISPAVASAKEGKDSDPLDLKVVFSQKRIWLLADEMPVKCLKTVVKNASGQVVLEKCFTSKCSEWFLNIEALPKGDYTLYLGADRVEKFKK